MQQVTPSSEKLTEIECGRIFVMKWINLSKNRCIELKKVMRKLYLAYFQVNTRNANLAIALFFSKHKAYFFLSNVLQNVNL